MKFVENKPNIKGKQSENVHSEIMKIFDMSVAKIQNKRYWNILIFIQTRALHHGLKIIYILEQTALNSSGS